MKPALKSKARPSIPPPQYEVNNNVINQEDEEQLQHEEQEISQNQEIQEEQSPME